MSNPCERCYLSLRHQRTAGRGVGCTHTTRASIMFIDDIATISDYKQNDIFVGRSTKILNKFIDDYKLSHWSYKTHLIKCVCQEAHTDYADKCFAYLIDEIHKVQPKIIITIGSFVYRYLKDENTRNMKNVVNKLTTFNNSILIPIYSPSYIIRNGCYDEYVKSFTLISDVFADICREYNWVKP